MADFTGRIERLEQRLDEREEAARFPLIGLADRAPRKLGDLTYGELVVLAQLGKLNRSDADPVLHTSVWEDTQLVFRIHMTEERIRELEREGMRDRKMSIGDQVRRRFA